jgi:F-type H+-transporting ATPase subunit a
MNVLTHPIAFYLLGLPVRSTVVMTWILMVVIVLLVLLIKKTNPAILETIIEFILNIVGDVLNVDNLYPYLSLLGSLFIFLISANLLSLLPGLTSPTADLNTTIALSLIVFFSVHYFGMLKKGVWGYLKTVADPIFLLPLEVIGQISRSVALALRLFGNIMSGDLIVAIIFSIVPLIVPLPLITLSMVTGVVQAYIFITLATLYIASAVEISQADEDGRKTRKKLFRRKEVTNGKS